MLDLLVLVEQCSIKMDYPIVHALVKHESAFNPFAINLNHSSKIVRPTNYEEAINIAKNLISHGYNIDLGLAQINSKNLTWLNLSVEQVFDPCNNLKAMEKVYLSCYAKAGENGFGTRMQRTLSCYNTGNFKSGFFNNYVNKVTTHFNQFVNNNSDINSKPLPKKSEGLAIYANALLSADNPNNTKQSINVGNTQDIAIDKPKQYPSWDIFQDF